MSGTVIRALPHAEADKLIAKSGLEIEAGRPGASADEVRTFAIAGRHARAAVQELARAPLTITLDWPAGIPRGARDTLTVQLRVELQRALTRRLSLELAAIYLTAPAILKDLAEWAQELASEPAPTPAKDRAWWKRRRPA